MSVALARQLREGTKKAHTMAENTGFVSCFLKGVVDKSTYKNLLIDLYLVYSAMEDEIRRLSDLGNGIISSIDFPELNRKKALEEDLIFFFGTEWSNQVRPTNSAKEYVERIHYVAQESPELLLGHHYTRYIGDLSGGQILKRIAQKAMNLNDDGLHFYEFNLIPDEKEFKLEYSQVLNSLPIENAIVPLIVDEANICLLYTSPSPRDRTRSRMPSSA